MNNYGSVENFCRELQEKIARLHRLQTLSIPAVDKAKMATSAEVMQEIYFDLVDSDLYRR